MTIIIVFVVYAALEAAYLYLFRTNYKQNFATVQSGKDVLYRFFPFGILCYTILAFALWYFVLQPATSYHDGFMRATILALVVYGVYNLTNLATFYKFGIALAIQDIVWGILVFNIAAFLHFWLTHRQR